MTNTLWDLILIFFKTGAFTFGGGYAMIPLLQSELVPTYLQGPEMSNLVALAQVTPGPVGLNTATYIGFTETGFAGAFLCTFALAIPGFLIASGVSCFRESFKENKIVKACLSGIRPVVIGMIASVVFFFADKSVLTAPIQSLWRSNGETLGLSWRGMLIFAITIALELKWKPSVLITLSVAALLGLLLYSF